MKFLILFFSVSFASSVFADSLFQLWLNQEVPEYRINKAKNDKRTDSRILLDLKVDKLNHEYYKQRHDYYKNLNEEKSQHYESFSGDEYFKRKRAKQDSFLKNR